MSGFRNTVAALSLIGVGMVAGFTPAAAQENSADQGQNSTTQEGFSQAVHQRLAGIEIKERSAAIEAIEKTGFTTADFTAGDYCIFESTIKMATQLRFLKEFSAALGSSENVDPEQKSMVMIGFTLGCAQQYGDTKVFADTVRAVEEYVDSLDVPNSGFQSLLYTQ